MKTITTEELSKMRDEEGLVIRGCGGDLQEWADGITEQLQEAGALPEGEGFKEVSAFVQEDAPCLLFHFKDENLDIGKLAAWRLQTYMQFGAKWLSDYLDQNMDSISPRNTKPDCALIGEDGNIFNLMGIAARTLRQNGMSEQATEMCGRTMKSGSYHTALAIIGEYVNITSVDEPECDEDMDMGIEEL